MRLFHISEESDIDIFKPRVLDRRKDMDQGSGLVWAVNEERLYNFLFPRECPRISTFKNEEDESCIDIEFSTTLVAVEKKWIKKINECKIYVYEFETQNFELQDECAGYYVSRHIEKPINKTLLDDCFGELYERDVKVLILDNLWDLHDLILKNSKNFSFCKMNNALIR